MSHPVPNTSSIFYVLKKYLGRWIIASAHYEKFAWSGSRWVPIGGDVQICNFAELEEARAFARTAGLMPVLAMADDEVRAIWRNVANGVGNHGDFLRSFAWAIVYADPENFPILRTASIFLIAKYQLESLAAESRVQLTEGKEVTGS